MASVLLLLLLAQSRDPEVQISKTLSGIQGLLQDPIKNADELDRRFAAIGKWLAVNPESKSREAAVFFLGQTAWKTGRIAEAFSASKERLKAKAQPLEGEYQQAMYLAALAVKPNEVLSILDAMAKDYPKSGWAASREALAQELPRLGRPASSVSIPSLDGSPFSWSAATKDKIVYLYFTASW